MRARNARDRRARKGRYFLRDLAGFADVDRLLATNIIGERLAPDVADDDTAPDASGTPPSHPQPQTGQGARRRR